jgi:PAS domain S-box-containing protein
MTSDDKLNKELQAENEELRLRLGEAEETLRAIRSGEVDAIVVSGPQGEQIFTLEGPEHPYRVLVESMNEGAITLAGDGTVFYCNSRLAAMLRLPLERIIGTPFSTYMEPSDRKVFAAMLMKCPTEECRGEVALMTGGGASLPVQLSCNALEVAGKLGASIVITDLTEQKKYRKKLEEQFRQLRETHRELEISRDRYSDLFDFAPLGYVCLDKKGAIRDINLTGAKLLGSTRDDLAGRPFISRIHGKDKRIFLKHLQVCRQTKGIVHSDLTLTARGGTAIQAQLYSVPSCDPAGDTLFRTAIIDITERLRALEEVRQAREEAQSLEKYNDLYNFAPVGYVTLDRDGLILACNVTGASLMGVERSRLIGRPFGEFVADGDRPSFTALIDAIFTGHDNNRCDVELLNEGNLPRFVQIEAMVACSGEECRIALIDRSKRKEAETALRTSEERLNLALAASRMGVWEWNVQTNALFWSPQTYEIFGVESFNGILDSFTNALHPDDADRIFAAARQALAENKPYTMEYRIIRPDGQVRWLSDLAWPVYDDKGNPLRLTGTVHDITEQKLAEEKLRKSELTLAEAQRIAHLGSWQWDSISGKITGSDEFYRIYGRFFSTYAEFLETVHPDDRHRVSGAGQNTLDRQSSFDLNHRIVLPDGTIRMIHCRGEAATGGDGTGARIIGTVQDITERKQLEEKLEFQRKELIARAAELEAANIELDAFNHSVSHDLRRPLTVINSYCQVVLELCGNRLGEECEGYIREIYETTLHMSQFIETLLVFSRITRAENRHEKVDLSKIAEEVASGLKIMELKRRVTFRVAEGITVKGDAGLLRLVLDNLIDNAWKFTRGREDAVIEFGVTEVDGKPACFVRDNGPGFDMAYADKLFMPFQRLPGTDVEGHGIGLATVDRIVKRHGGKVWAESKPGKGATFYFTLPGGRGGAAGRQP